jgi:hypothetical protein
LLPEASATLVSLPPFVLESMAENSEPGLSFNLPMVMSSFYSSVHAAGVVASPSTSNTAAASPPLDSDAAWRQSFCVGMIVDCMDSVNKVWQSRIGPLCLSRLLSLVFVGCLVA